MRFHLPVVNFLRTRPLLSLHLLIWGLFFTIVWSHQFIPSPAGIAAGSLGSWSDGAAHLTYATNIAYHSRFPQFLPIFYDHPFTYSFAADLLTALLVRSGVNLFTAYTGLGLLLSLSFVYLLYRFYQLFLNSSTGAIVASWLFLLSGGLGFIWFFQDAARSGLLSTLLRPPHEYTHIAEVALEWINPITSELIPQRAFLLGLPIGLIILTYLWKLTTKPKNIQPSYTLAAAILLGFMPIIHPHTFIVLCFVTAFILFRTIILKPQNRFSLKPLLTLITISSIISLPLIITFILPAAGSGFIRFYPGWLAQTKDINWLWFWLLNWGAFPLIVLLGTFFLGSSQRRFLVPFIFIFIASNLFLFQPFDWDNSKLLTWVYLVLSAPAAVTITTLFDRRVGNRFLAVALFVILTFSGSLDASGLLNPLRAPLPMYTKEELNLASWVNANTAPDSLFLTSDRHSHPVPNLTGRNILMGYRGWLWTYGIDYRDREKQVADIYSGSDTGLSLALYYGINYVVVGPSELEQFRPNLAFFRHSTKLVYQSPHYSIFQLH